MEGKNYEMSPEELAQGVGGVEDWQASLIREAVVSWKRRGGTLEQFVEYYGSKNAYVGYARQIWNEV